MASLASRVLLCIITMLYHQISLTRPATHRCHVSYGRLAACSFDAAGLRLQLLRCLLSLGLVVALLLCTAGRGWPWRVGGLGLSLLHTRTHAHGWIADAVQDRERHADSAGLFDVCPERQEPDLAS